MITDADWTDDDLNVRHPWPWMACRCAATPLHRVEASSSLICYVVRLDERHNLRRYRPVCRICDHAVNTVEYWIDNLLAKRLPTFTHMKHIAMLIYLHSKYCILITCYLTEEDKTLQFRIVLQVSFGSASHLFIIFCYRKSLSLIFAW